MDEKCTDVMLQTSPTTVSHYDAITSLEQQTYTNKIIVNDLIGFKSLTREHYVCINDGQLLFDNTVNDNNMKNALHAESGDKLNQSHVGHREETYLGNMYKMVCEQQDSSEGESISEIINLEDLQNFRKKLSDFCKLIPEMEVSSDSTLSTTSETETFDGSDSVQVLYKPLTPQSDTGTQDQPKLLSDSSECLKPMKRLSSEDILSVMKIWNTCVQY